jgi:hypothetical protein
MKLTCERLVDLAAGEVEAGKTVTTQAGSFSDQCRKGGLDRAAEWLPRQTAHAHGGRLIFRGENAEAASTMSLAAQDRRNRHAPYQVSGRNRCKADVFRDALKERGQGQRPPTGNRSGSRAWERPVDFH